MTRAEKSGFRTVEEADVEDYKQKIREHRIKVFKRSVLAVFVLALIFTGIGLYMALRQYTDYDIRSSVERADTKATKFEAFQGNILKYSNDGALYTDHNNEMIWNQTFEMAEPTIDKSLEEQEKKEEEYSFPGLLLRKKTAPSSEGA